MLVFRGQDLFDKPSTNILCGILNALFGLTVLSLILCLQIPRRGRVRVVGYWGEDAYVNTRIQEVLSQLLENDEAPPSDDYDHASFGRQLATSLGEGDCRALVLAALSQLPSCLASDFVEGVLQARRLKGLDSALITQIDECRHLDTAGVIVRLLANIYHVVPDDLVTELVARLKRAPCTKKKDKLAFALWTVFCGEALLLQEDKRVGFLASPCERTLRELMAIPSLSDYAHKALSECIAAMERRG